MMEKLLEIIGGKYTLTELPTPAEFSRMKVNGMKFSLSAYRAKNLGHVSIMSANGFFGLMRMDSLIVVPEEVDLPLLSYDRIKAMGNDTLIIELYDTLLSPYDGSPLERVKEKYSSIPDRDPGKHWYDDIKLKESISKKGKDIERMDGLTSEYLDAYISNSAETVTDKEQKRKKTEDYVSSLLSHGGPSTDVFIKKIGKEKTQELFENVLFGTSST